MKPCSRLPIVGRYHDGELVGVDRQEFEHHLANCPACNDELEGLKTLSEIVNGYASESMPPSLREDILKIPLSRRGADMLPIAKALTGVAALLLVFSLGFSSQISDWPSYGKVETMDSFVVEEWDSEVLEEPEAEVTHWVVAGLTHSKER